MSMFLGMGACMYPVVLILYALLCGQSNPRGGLLFGARLAEYLAKEPAVLEIRRKFRARLRVVTLVMAAIPLTFLLLPWFSIQLFLWILWVFALIVVIYIPYVRANKAVRRWKAETGHAEPGERAIFVELKQLGELRQTQFAQFWPAILLTGLVLITIFITQWGEPAVIGSAVCFALMTPLYAGCGAWMDRQRLKVISADSDVNLNYNRAMRQQWNRVWHLYAWLNTLYLLGYALCLTIGGLLPGMGYLLWGSLVYVAALLVVLVWLMVKNHQLDKAYRGRMDLVGYVNDDENWLWGLIYYNPGDFRVGVEKRFGIGTTINMATPVGKAMAVVLAVVLVGSTALCAWPIALEFTPISLTVEGEALVARQIRADYVIEVDDIQELTLVEELPSMAKSNGTGMETLLKGTFRRTEDGMRVKVFLDPENGCFLTFAANDTTYYMSCADDGETRALYETLLERVGQA